jgi:hypothetical protein
LAARLDNDITYVEISRDTARDVAAIVAPAVARQTSKAEQARGARAQRFALLQAAAVGAVLMILAAVQSFQYSVALPRPVMPAVICLLGAFALWSALVALQIAMSGRSGRWLPQAVSVSFGFTVAVAAWVVSTWIAVLVRSSAMPVVTTVVITTGTFLTATAITLLVQRRRRTDRALDSR